MDLSSRFLNQSLNQFEWKRFPNQSHLGGSTSVHFSLAVLHGYQLPPALLHVAEALRSEKQRITLLQGLYNCRNEVEGTMLEERFGLGEWEEGGVGGEDAENCTFWWRFLYHFHFLAKRKFSLSLSVRAVFLGWATEVTSLPPFQGASSSSGTSTTCGTGETGGAGGTSDWEDLN